MNQMLPRPRFWAEAAEQIKTRFTFFGETLILMLLYLIASTASGTVLAVPMFLWLLTTQSDTILNSVEAGVSVQELLLRLIDEMPDWMLLISLFATAASVGFVAVFYCRKFQKRSLSSMGLRREGAAGEYLAGFAVGLALFGGVLAVGTAAGAFRLGTWSLDPARVLFALAALLGCAARGAALELLFRGYYAPSLGARGPVVLAVLSSTLISGVLQSGGTLLSMSVLNALLLSLLLGIWVLKRGSLWGACAIQGAWTFAGSFLLDFAGPDQHGTLGLLDVDTDAFRPLLTGGEYGPEASICATVVLLAALAAVLALRPKDPAPEQSLPVDERPENNL